MADDAIRIRRHQLANTVGPDFDDDIVAEILLRLPAKSLLRFRCVCKSWLALISDPSFVKNHLSRINNTNHFNLLVGTHPLRVSVLKLDDGDVAISEFSYPAITSALPINKSPRIYGSCNGLVCVEYENGNFILWNPCTRELKQLPKPDLPELDESDCEGENLYLAGFGYDSTSADYKVIRAAKYYEEPSVFQVFTLKTGSWRFNADFNHISQGSEHICPLSEQAFLLNETLYWVALLGAEYEEATLGIISFGLAEEKLKVMALFPCRLPSPLSPISTSIVTAGNSLFVYHEFGIWMMKEYGVEESWTKIIHISSECLPRHFNECMRPFCILENGEVLLSNYRLTLGVYTPEEKTFRRVIWNCYEISPRCVACVETLVSPLTGEHESKWPSTVEKKGAEMELLSSVAPPGWTKKGRRTKRQGPKAAA